MGARYTFLPWTRRGLAAALPPATAPGPGVASPDPPARAAIDVAVTVAGIDHPIATHAVLHGPGDVVGLEAAQVLHRTPTPDATDVEPNFLVSVELDAAELPWLFTPSGVHPFDQLRPWLALAVVEDRPGVSVDLLPGRPLPRLRIEGGAAAELPDLADAHLWAHVQVLDTGGDPVDALATRPDATSARLICPRRLVPGRRWIAAVVPTTDVGRIRGLGGVPPADALTGSAWAPDADSVELPVLDHWRFQTGPEGDFESLAQRLTPYAATLGVGRVAMHVGDATPVPVPAGGRRVVDMDGALRAPALSDLDVADLDPATRDGLRGVTRTLADAADGVLDDDAEDADRPAFGPPLYGSAHVRRWRVDDADTSWFAELNLDPRPRVAAGLGTEIVRTNQEEIAAAAWRQVGDVVATEAALQRAALAARVGEAFHRRHVAALPDDVLLRVAGPLAPRVPFAGVSLPAAVRASSLPDAVVDPGLRRMLGPGGRAIRRAARTLGVAPSDLRPGLVGGLAAGRTEVDPTRFARPVITGIDPDTVRDTTSLAGIGLPIEVPVEVTAALAVSASSLAASRERSGVAPGLRPDLRRTGIVGTVHLDRVRDLARVAQAQVDAAVADGTPTTVATVTGISTAGLLDAVLDAVPPDADSGRGLVVTAPVIAGGVLTSVRAPVDVGVLDLDRSGSVVVRHGGVGAPNVTVAHLDRDRPWTAAEIARVVTTLPVGTIPATVFAAQPVVATPVTIERPFAAPARGPVGPGLPVDPRGPVVVDPRGPVVDPRDPGDGPVTVTMPPLLRDAGVLDRFEQAARTQLEVTVLATPTPTSTVVPFALAAAATTLRARTAPAVSQALRRDALVRIGGVGIGGLELSEDLLGWWTTRAVDRVMTYPTFPVPAYEYLTRYDRTRFCPGVDEIPPDSVTLLETNPRFIAAFMAGLNHETNRELLWRGYPTDGRGTPFRRFWNRLDGRDDVPPVHTWRGGSLAGQTTDPKGNIVLVVRGALLRRYPHTIVLAVPAVGPRTWSDDPSTYRHPVFAGRFDPDVSFFGFDLTDSDLARGEGWFFALLEPVTTPRFGLDETRGAGTGADAFAWPATGVPPGGHLGRSALGALRLNGAAATSDVVAAALWQKPFALYAHARHLLTPLPNPR